MKIRKSNKVYNQLLFNNKKTIKVLRDILKEKEEKNLARESIFQHPEIFTIIKMVLSKYEKDENDIYILSNYLKSLKTFIASILQGQSSDFDVMPLLRKISSDLYCVSYKKNSFMMRIGDIGNTFYVILSGSVSIVVPKEISILMTRTQYINHLNFLSDLGEKYLVEKNYYNNIGEFPDLKLENFINNDKNNNDLKKNLAKKLRTQLKYEVKNNKKIKEENDNESNDNDIIINKNKEDNNNNNNNSSKNKEDNNNNKNKEDNNNNNNSSQNKEDNNNNKNKEDNNNNNNNQSKNSSDDDSNDEINDEMNDKDVKDQIKKNVNKEEKKDEFSLEKYIKLINGEYIKPVKDKYLLHNIKLLGYFKVTDLNQGNSFGELALINLNQQRTATIFVKEDSFFGVLKAESYNQSLKSIQEIKKRKEVNFVFNTKLFQQIPLYEFSTKYWNYFISRKIKNGDYLFKQGYYRDEIYFILDGEIKITTYNLNLKKTNMYLEEIGNFIFGKYAFSNVGKNINVPLFIAVSGDILGMNDILYQDKYLCNAVCISSKASYFALNYNIFKNLSTSFPKIFKTWKKLDMNKRILMVQRLENIIYTNKNSLAGNFRKDEENIAYWQKLYNINDTKKEHKKNSIFINLHTSLKSFSLNKKNNIKEKNTINHNKSIFRFSKTNLPPLINPFQDYQNNGMNKTNKVFQYSLSNYDKTLTTEPSISRTVRFHNKTNIEDSFRKKDFVMLELKKNVMKNNKHDLITRLLFDKKSIDNNNNKDKDEDYFFVNPEKEIKNIEKKFNYSSNKKPKYITFYNKNKNVERNNFLLTELNDFTKKRKAKTKTQFSLSFDK